MKKMIFACFCLFTVMTQAQDCEYALRIENDDQTVTKMTKEKVVYYQATPLKTDLVYLSLYIEKGVPLVLFKYSRDSKTFPSTMCIDNNARLSFQLTDGSIVSLMQAGEESCGYINNLKGLDKQNSTVENFFYLPPDAISKLKKNKITLMGLRSATDKKDFVIPSEIVLGQPNIVIHPDNYFIENLHCIE